MCYDFPLTHRLFVDTQLCVEHIEYITEIRALNTDINEQPKDDPALNLISLSCLPQYAMGRLGKDRYQNWHFIAYDTEVYDTHNVSLNETQATFSCVSLLMESGKNCRAGVFRII
jgi:hypothetical protein